MRFPIPLQRATLLRRYKRFLADVLLADGTEVTVHCPNPGAMTGLAEAGTICWLAPAQPSAKLPFGWKVAELADGTMAMIDTTLANGIVHEALALGLFPELPHHALRREARMDADSRIDFRLETDHGPLWLEVKSVTLRRQAIAEFPDTKTARGTKHLQGLIAAHARGEGAALVFLLARSDCDALTVAADIDPAYAAALAQARAAGVLILGLKADVTPQGITPLARVAVL